MLENDFGVLYMLVTSGSMLAVLVLTALIRQVGFRSRCLSTVLTVSAIILSLVCYAMATVLFVFLSGWLAGICVLVVVAGYGLLVRAIVNLGREYIRR